jgi:hypothetical protein
MGAEMVSPARRVVFALSLACAFLLGALVGPSLGNRVDAQTAKIESRCVKNEEDANALGREGWEVVTSAGAGSNQFRYCFVRRL